MANYIPPGMAVALDGRSARELREETITAYQAGVIQYLVNCGLFLEGFDAPSTSCIAMARPTKSRSLYAQAIGRGSRTVTGTLDGLDTVEERRAAILASTAPDCLVFDFVGNSGRHRLVGALDVLAGRPLPPDVEKRALELARTMPSEEALAQAEEDSIERERRREAARRREAKLRVNVACTMRQIDPFGIITDDRGPRASVAQLDYLATLKVELKGHVPSRREASTLIDTIQKRKTDGLCTYKQARFLATKGLDPNLTFKAARTAMDAIVANKWRVPDWVRDEFSAEEEQRATG